MSIKYSVLMSVYKKENPGFLKESIQSMLNQTKKPNEFILIEDGPLTKELYDVIDFFCTEKPKLFNIIKLEKNVGLGPALAVGVEKARYDYIARMDSDDISEKTRIEKEINEFIKDKSLVIVGTNVDEFEGSISNVVSRVVLPQNHQDIVLYNKKRSPFRHPCILFKKKEIMSVGNYRKYDFFEDYDLYNRIISKGYKCKNIQESLVYVRTSSDFYKRRSGISYVIIMSRFRWGQYKMGITNLFEFLIYTTSHALVCLMPNTLRKIIYKKILRKNHYEK